MVSRRLHSNRSLLLARIPNELDLFFRRLSTTTNTHPPDWQSNKPSHRLVPYSNRHTTNRHRTNNRHSFTSPNCNAAQQARSRPAGSQEAPRLRGTSPSPLSALLASLFRCGTSCTLYVDTNGTAIAACLGDCIPIYFDRRAVVARFEHCIPIWNRSRRSSNWVDINGHRSYDYVAVGNGSLAYTCYVGADDAG